MPTDTPEQDRPHPRHRLHRLLAAVAIALVAVVVLAACGSSGKSTTTSASATNSAAATQNPVRSNRFASVRACLEKQGIKLSAPSGGQPGSGGPPGPGGGFKLPEGVSRSKFREALKKCGGGFRGGFRGRFNSATARAAFTKYSSCMRENGVNLPAPNTSGKGPIFNTKGIDTSSAAFKKAEQKCQGDLRGAFGGRARPPGGGQGAPPSGEGAPPAGGEGAPPAAGPPAGEGAPGA